MKKSFITVSVLLFLVAGYIIFQRFILQEKKGNSSQEEIQITGTPIDNTRIKEAIKNTEKITHCLLTNANFTSEYHINGENILVKNSTSTDGSNFNFYTLKIDGEVYSWDSTSNNGTTFNITSTEKIKNNPTLKEYLKLTPNTYLLDSDGVAELQSQGYKVNCELIDNNPNLFKAPDIAFSYLKNPPTSEPNSIQ